MKHFGNVCNIDGKSVDPVDIITFGAPCQDLSVAGKRSGMKHEVLGDNETTRSGLFFEAIRIIKEMRESTNGEYPKYAVYENVPGAFSSNKGRDFHAVLEALCSVCDDAVSIPEPYDKKRTKLVWAKAGEIVGDDYSIAWRTLDAQYWGVPQRRKRIYLVADFTGRRAGEILFKQDGLRGDMQTGNETGQGVAADAVGSVDGSAGNGGQLAATLISSYGTKWNGNAGAYNGENFVLQKHSVDRSVGAAGVVSKGNGDCFIIPEKHMSLSVGGGQAGQGYPCTVYSFDSLSSNSMKSSNPFSGCRAVEIAKCIDTTYPDPSKNQGGVAVVQECLGYDMYNQASTGDKTRTLKTPAGGDDLPVVCVLNDQGGSSINVESENLSPTLRANSHQHEPVIALQANGIDRAYGIDHVITTGGNCTAQGSCVYEHTQATLKAGGVHAVCFEPGAMVRDMGNRIWEGQSPTLRATMGDNQPAVCFDRATFNQGINAQYDFEVSEEGVVSTVVAKGPSGVCYDARGNGDGETACTITGDHQNRITDYTAVTVQKSKPPRKYIIRRLTPTECARLQGFPDWWGRLAPYNPADAEFWEDVRKTHAEINGKKYKPVKDIKKWYEKLHTDSAEYKAYGNGLALPCAEFVIRGIAEVLRNEKGQFASKGGVIEHKGYTCIYKPEHPRAKTNGYVREHILVAEEMLGRPLDGEEVVHHINGDKADNRPENLEIFPTHAEHVRHHNRTDGKKYSYNGGEFTVAELSEFSVVDYSVLTQRINKLGWDIKRAVETPKRGQPTLGSLFDGIGGFPLAGAMNGIMPVWASEVEPYPIAVTKSRFKEAHNGK